MDSAQIPVNFAPEAKNVLNARKLIVRAGAVARYDEAIAYLREELKSGESEHIKADEFAHAFNITSSFLFLVASIGAVEVVRKKKGNHYKALPKLATLTGQELRDHRLSDFPNPPYTPEPTPVLPAHLLDKTPEQRNAFVKAMNDFNISRLSTILEQNPTFVKAMNEFDPKQFEESANTETGILREPGESTRGLLQHELHGEKPTYLVGSLEADNNTVMKLQTADKARFSDLDTARQCVQQYPSNVGTRIVIVQVIEVVLRTTILQPAIL